MNKRIKNERFLKACRKEPVDITPVWIMRQAGRYMKEYQAIRAKVDFLTLCKTPDLATEATLLPVNLLDVDVAILFSDILIPVEAMGLEVVFTENKGPVFPSPIRNQEQIRKLTTPRIEERTPFVFDAIRKIRKELDGRVPLIGFSGAPYTLATYMIEGETSRNFNAIKKWMYQSPTLLHELLEKTTTTVMDYVRAQVEAGAETIQIFDTWAGALSGDEYQFFSFPYTKRIIAEIKKSGVPAILYLNGGGLLLERLVATGADVISLDWRTDLRIAREQFGNKVAFQGNLEPCVLYGDSGTIRSEVKKILEKFGKGPGHIFNLGHGILPDTPFENAKEMIRAVHEESAIYHK
ncbi:MAG: uroporphyrinogen decarboxylase [Nitrospirae bacterium]|nr:uroporphyrinogen decarboxylase [Nitrospirota bacterium]